MNTKEALLQKYTDNDNQLGKRELGQLRRILLTEVLDNIISNDCLNADKWLDKKKSRLDKNKLASAVGYGITPDNIRQSFVKQVKEAEEVLRVAGKITTKPKTNSQIHNENLEAFTSFLKERLDEDGYYWPKNAKGFLYRKAIWAYFLDIPPEEVKYLPSFINSDAELAEMLSNIDILISEDQVKSIDYKRESALDEMEDTMTNRALSAMRLKLKEKSEEVVLLREELKETKQELAELKQQQKSLLSQGLTAFKQGSAH
ncbi:hypothetical protein NQU96_07190 [Pseudoalteromonas elyakovii]|nr:hypothetical protein [Pseudoalteromonas elyakovii]